MGENDMIAKCPVCKSCDIKKIKIFQSAKIDNSLIYKDIIILQCRDCGHHFNLLDKRDINNLCDYYLQEYVDNNYSRTQYEERKIFCDYFFDGDRSYVINQNNMDRYITELVMLNTANSLYSGEYDFIAAEHILEHCWDIDRTIINIKKHISNDGYIYVSVPDQAKYNETYFYLIKEHIQHFTCDQILYLFKKYGFKLVRDRKYNLDILGGKLKLPSMEFLFKLKDKDIFNPDGIYCFGVGKEFLYMYESYFKTGKLIDKEIAGLIDDTPAKKDKTVDGLNIYNSDIVTQLSEKSSIIITSWYHREEMTKKLKQLNYRGKYLDEKVISSSL